MERIRVGGNLILILLANAALSIAEEVTLLPEIEPSSVETPQIAVSTTPAIQPGSELAELRARLEKLEKIESETTEKATRMKLPTVNPTAQIQVDSYFIGQDAASRQAHGHIPEGADFRRARFGLFVAYGPTAYRIEMDFALAGRPSFLDVFADINEIPVFGHFRIGHFFEPFLLDRLISNRFVPFLERSLTDNAFAPARNLGAMAFNSYAEKHGTWAIGLFHTESDVHGDSVGTGFDRSVTGRVTFLPWYREVDQSRHLLHLGGAASYRDPVKGIARFRSQPEVRLGSSIPNIPYFVDTGNLTTRAYQLIGLESALVHGPFWMQAEYVWTPVETVAYGTVLFQSGYVEGGVFLTGESRPYRRDTGVFDRVIPFRDTLRMDRDHRFEWGPGAVELAARLSYLDLNDHAIRGGHMTDLTVSLNWHLNPYLRFSGNVVRSWGTTGAGLASTTDLWGIRTQYEF